MAPLQRSSSHQQTMVLAMEMPDSLQPPSSSSSVEGRPQLYSAVSEPAATSAWKFY